MKLKIVLHVGHQLCSPQSHLKASAITTKRMTPMPLLKITGLIFYGILRLTQRSYDETDDDKIIARRNQVTDVDLAS